MGNDEVTEELDKKAADVVDLEIDEWLKLSGDLNWEPRQPYVCI